MGKRLAAVPFVLFLVLLAVGTASADHYPPEIGHLNRVDHIANIRCVDDDTGRSGACAVLFDQADAVFYIAFYYGERLVKVWRIQSGGREVIWLRSVCEEEPCA